MDTSMELGRQRGQCGGGDGGGFRAGPYLSVTAHRKLHVGRVVPCFVLSISLWADLGIVRLFRPFDHGL